MFSRIIPINKIFFVLLGCLALLPCSSVLAQVSCDSNTSSPAACPIRALSVSKTSTSNDKVVTSIRTTARKSIDKACRVERGRSKVVSARIAVARNKNLFQGTANYEYQCVPYFN